MIEGMDNVGIVVDDLDAAVAFFTEPGLEREGEARSSASCSDAYKSGRRRGRSGLWSSTPSTTQTRLPCARHGRAVSADKRTNENLA